MQQLAIPRMTYGAAAFQQPLTEEELRSIEICQEAQSQRRGTFDESLGFNTPDRPPELGPPASELMMSQEEFTLIAEAKDQLEAMVENIGTMGARFNWPEGIVEEALRQPTSAAMVSYVVCFIATKQDRAATFALEEWNERYRDNPEFVAEGRRVEQSFLGWFKRPDTIHCRQDEYINKRRAAMAKLNYSEDQIALAASQQAPMSWLRSAGIRTDASNDFVEQCRYVAWVVADDDLAGLFDDNAVQHAQVQRLILNLDAETIGLRGYNKLLQWESRCMLATDNNYVRKGPEPTDLIRLPVRLPDPCFATSLEALTYPG